MIKKASLMLVPFLLFASTFAESAPLRVVLDGVGCPTRVLGDNSCPGRSGDNVACRPPGPVRWVPVNEISVIATKDGSGALHNCSARPNQGYYQCIVRGNIGEEVHYYVTSTSGCTLDPIIILN